MSTTNLIEKVTTRSKSSTNPTIVTFQSGTPLELDNEVRFATEKDNQDKTILLAAYRGNVNTIYRGEVNEGEVSNLVGTYLAIRNKVTNKVRLIEVDNCLVKSSHHYEKPDVAPGLEIDARSLLYKSFGSKSALRAMERKEKTAYNSDFVEKNINDTIGSVPDMDESKLEEETNEVVAVNSVKTGRYKKKKQ